LLLRILLIGYLYGITSERKLVEELGMHLAMALVHRARLRPGDSASLKTSRALDLAASFDGLQSSADTSRLSKGAKKALMRTNLE
jgi:hypothetical protein